VGVADPNGNTDAFTLEDDNGAAFEILHAAYTIGALGSKWLLVTKVKKDAVAAATRYPLFRIEWTGGTTSTADIVVDTSTGSYSTIANGGSAPTLIRAEVNDLGDWWEVCIAAEDTGSNTIISAYVFPAAGTTTLDHSYLTSATGAITMFEPTLQPVYIEEGHAVATVRNTTGAAIVT
jgi:hypothetical protein